MDRIISSFFSGTRDGIVYSTGIFLVQILTGKTFVTSHTEFIRSVIVGSVSFSIAKLIINRISIMIFEKNIKDFVETMEKLKRILDYIKDNKFEDDFKNFLASKGKEAGVNITSESLETFLVDLEKSQSVMAAETAETAETAEKEETDTVAEFVNVQKET